MTWTQIVDKYPGYLTEIKLKQPKRRISALHKIEQYLQSCNLEIINGNILIAQINKLEFKQKYESYKGCNLNGAETQVINDFYKISTSSLLIKIS
jgi:hypothetical protein